MELAAEPERERTGDSCDSGSNDSSCSIQENNTKLFNHESNSRRNSAFRLMGYSENSVNNGNLNRIGAVDNYMPIPLALISFSNGANLENFLFGTFIFVIYFGVLILNIIPEWGERVLDLCSWVGGEL